MNGSTTYAGLLATVALRIRTAPTTPTPFLEAIATLLDEQAKAADECPGLNCPLLDCDGAPTSTRIHHHCPWCNESEWPAAIDVAHAYLEQR